MHFHASFHFYLMPQIIQKINLELKKKRVKCYSIEKKDLKGLSVLSTELLDSLSYFPVPILAE